MLPMSRSTARDSESSIRFSERGSPVSHVRSLPETFLQLLKLTVAAQHNADIKEMQLK